MICIHVYTMFKYVDVFVVAELKRLLEDPTSVTVAPFTPRVWTRWFFPGTLGVLPLPGCQCPAVWHDIFRFGDPERNLHLPLESWEATPNPYLSANQFISMNRTKLQVLVQIYNMGIWRTWLIDMKVCSVQMCVPSRVSLFKFTTCHTQPKELTIVRIHTGNFSWEVSSNY